MGSKRDPEGFLSWLFENLWDASPDECDIQDKAEECGLVRSVPGGFDPEKHTDTSGWAEPGCEWYEVVEPEVSDGE